MQPGAVVFGQVAVAHRLDVFGQAVVPGADLAVFGMGHHGQAALRRDGEHPRHDGVVHDAVAVLGDELDVVRQREQVVDGLAVEVLGDGHRLVGVAQADAFGFVLHGVGDLGRGADRFGVGHQVYEGVPARGRRGGAGGDILFIFKAGRAPVAVGVDKRGQRRAAFGVEHFLPLWRQQPRADGGDLAAAQPEFDGVAGAVFRVADQHGQTSCLQMDPPRKTARGQKKTFPKKGKVKKRYPVQCQERTPHRTF